MRYLALLRGINVGGNNVIKMADLKSCFEDMGFSDVVTYIQSGNVVFSAKAGSAERLARIIEKALAKRFRYDASVVVLAHADLRRAVTNAPMGFGTRPTERRYDVIFLKKPLTAKAAMKSVRTREGVDEADAGRDVLYFSRLTALASRSLLPKLVSTPEYQFMTIRNWNTTTKLLAIMDAEQ